MFPDAIFCGSKSLVKTLKAARPVTAPAQPPPMMERYATRNTAHKLGIVKGTSVAVLNPPGHLSDVLGELPAQVEFTEHSGAAVTLCFIHSVDGLRSDLSNSRGLAAKSKLWIIWRKKGSPSHNGVTGSLVRNTGLDLGLVDYKICSLDKDWIGMLFAHRSNRL